MQDQLALAKTAAHAAGEVLQKYFRVGLETSFKADCNTVSIADVEAQTAIVELISATFPDHSILSEEGIDEQRDIEHLWILDPLDGTTNFLHGLDQFAVSIAYYHRGIPTVGVVYQPTKNEWFTAVRGEGAFHNNTQVHVSTATELTQALIGFGFYYDRSSMMEDTLSALRKLFHQNIQGVRRFGSASLDLCYLGAGYFDAFFEYTLYPWDFAAARVFLEEAGGIITTTSGGELPLAVTSVLATNTRLHPMLLPLLTRSSDVEVS